MAATQTREHEDILDLLLDLQHDLGKYIRMPLAYLPRDATADAIHAALHTALFETRKGPRGTRSARQMWEAYAATVGDSVRSTAAYPALVAAVERALGWEAAASDTERQLDRQSAEADLSAVGPAIRAVVQELNDRA